MNGKSVYIAGPMRGYPELNFPAFFAAASLLESQGWTAVNPAVINPDPDTPYAECMKNDIKALIECDAIYMLRGWGTSTGAMVEYQIANALGLEIMYEL